MASAYERIPVRWRLAIASTLLTFVILCGFAAIVSETTARTIRSDFANQIKAAADEITGQLSVNFGTEGIRTNPNLEAYAAPDRAVVRLLTQDGRVLVRTPGTPDFGFPRVGDADIGGWRVATRRAALFRDSDGAPFGAVVIQYARRLSDVNATINRVRTFLLLGVLGGSALAFGAGMMIARRAMAPIAALTATTREIARTRDPNRRVPVPASEDEVSELARTLDDMLRALEGSRAENAAMLDRQRDFVADASHELRTPLTSVLANLELLEETLEGERREAAASALRSSRRMRRLVADLLLLARADARRTAAREELDFGRVVVEAVGELGPLAEAGHHPLDVHAAPGAAVVGARDELHRVALNLVGNAINHTPDGTPVHVVVERDGEEVVLAVRDEGPGVPEELRGRLFERFVRGSGDRGGSSGLGLAIVQAVTEAHGGSVELAPDDPERPGARFEVRLPAAPVAGPEPDTGADGEAEAEDGPPPQLWAGGPSAG